MLSVEKNPDGSISLTQWFSVALALPAVIEPKEAGLVIALVSKLIINNPRFGEFWRGVPKPEPETEHEDNKDASSSTTSVNELEITHHHFDPWTHA